jgi:ribosomal protein L22
VAVAENARSVRAQAKWVRTSARKARLVAEHIRGRTVPEARTVLAFTPRAAAREIEKVLRSAVANAEANHGFVGDDLYVSTAIVDEGPTLKRGRPRARGRFARIHKRTCHITLTLEPMPEELAPKRAEPEKSKSPSRTRKPKVETAEAVAEAAEPEAAEPEAPAEPEKPKRTRKKKTEEEEH